MNEGTHNLTVGKDVTSGHVRYAGQVLRDDFNLNHILPPPPRVSTPLPYYISELLYVPEACLQNTRTVPLHVFTIGTCVCCDGAQSLPAFLKDGALDVTRKHEDDSSPKQDTPTPGPPPKRVKISPAPDSATSAPQVPLTHSIQSSLTDLTPSVNCVCSLKCTDITVSKCAVTILKAALQGCAAWWLDIDLDFFSTTNPFKSIFTKVVPTACFGVMCEVDVMVGGGCDGQLDLIVRWM